LSSLIKDKYINIIKSIIKMPDINESFKKGNIGEREFIRYLAARADTSHICNVSLVPEYQKRGIDIIWYKEPKTDSRIITADESELEHLVNTHTTDEDLVDESMQRYTFEVKTCGRISETGNFFLEKVSNVEKRTVGSFFYTEAGIYTYYSLNEHIFYLMPMPKTRDWIKARRFYEAMAETFENDILLYHTLGLLVPRKTLLKEQGLSVKQIRNPFSSETKLTTT